MKAVERVEDMSNRGRLRIYLQPDGDVIVAVLPDPKDSMRKSVEFCSHMGGGRSPNTLKALRGLISAIEDDNAKFPIEEQVAEALKILI